MAAAVRSKVRAGMPVLFEKRLRKLRWRTRCTAETGLQTCADVGADGQSLGRRALLRALQTPHRVSCRRGATPCHTWAGGSRLMKVVGEGVGSSLPRGARSVRRSGTLLQYAPPRVIHVLCCCCI